MNEPQKKSLHYLETRLKELSSEGLFDEYKITPGRKTSEFSVALLVNGKRQVVIETNLKDAYRVLFGSSYEESTDYLLAGDAFKSHIDWFMPFIKAYLRHDYGEIKYRDKKTGDVVYTRLVFNQSDLGGRELISYAPKWFYLKKLFGGYYIDQAN